VVPHNTSDESSFVDMETFKLEKVEGEEESEEEEMELQSLVSARFSQGRFGDGE